MKPKEFVRALCKGQVKLAVDAIRDGIDVNVRYRGCPLLSWAIQESRLHVVKALVDAGVSLERRDILGFTALDIAVGQGNIGMVRFLLRSGANVNGRTTNGTPLHTACAYRYLAIAKLLLDFGADPSAKDHEGRRPLAFTRMGKTNRLDHRLEALLRKFRTQRRSCHRRIRAEA